MKKIFLSLLVVANCASAVFAQDMMGIQDMRINAYFGGNLADTFATGSWSNGSENAKVTGDFAWGIGVEKKLNMGVYAELSYFMQNDKLKYSATSNSMSFSEQSSVSQFSNFILVGANKYFREDSKVQPFVGAQLGMNILNVGDEVKWSQTANGVTVSGSDNFGQNGNISKQQYKDGVYKGGNTVKFAWGIRAGANYKLNDNFALKAQVALLSTVGVYSNPDGDLASQISGGIFSHTSTSNTFRPSLYQVNFTAGLVYNLHSKK